MFFSFLTEWTVGNVAIRIIASLALGSLIGIDRGAKRRGGGARTDATVCMGAALVMITAQYMYVTFSGDSDIARMGAQAVSGVGFLGAGSIIVSGHQVKGPGLRKRKPQDRRPRKRRPPKSRSRRAPAPQSSATAAAALPAMRSRALLDA